MIGPRSGGQMIAIVFADLARIRCAAIRLTIEAREWRGLIRRTHLRYAFGDASGLVHNRRFERLRPCARRSGAEAGRQSSRLRPAKGGARLACFSLWEVR